MAFIDLGKLKFNWQGTWNSGTAYETDDVVFHGSQTFVATADIATGQAEPQANNDWSLMAAGFNYRGTYASGTTYYLHDVVTYGSALYMLEGIAETGSQTGVDPGSNPGSDNWEQLTPAPAANVMHAVGDMVFRNNANANARLPVSETVGLALNVGESPKETYSSRQFTYTLNGTNGNVINTPGSIAAVTYNIAVKAQRSENYVIDGSDRDGDINWEYDGTIRVNIGDTVVFDTSAIHPSHPLAIRVSAGGASVSTGTYTGEGTATVTWVTTGVAAGTYYYQCTAHPGMVGQIIVESTENRQGSAGANGTMEVCRGKTYTVTLDGLTSGLTYNLFNAAAPQAGVTNAITSGEGNSAPNGTAYSGSAVTFTFTPNETTPDIVYLSSASNTNDQVAITVNDLAYVPGWSVAAPDDELVLDDQSGNFTTTLTTGTQTASHIWTFPVDVPVAGDALVVSSVANTNNPTLEWGSVSTGNFGNIQNATLSGNSTITFSNIPSDAVRVILTFRDVNWNTSSDIYIRLGNATQGVITTNYSGNTTYFGASGSGACYTTYMPVNYGWTAGNSYTFHGVFNIDVMNGHMYMCNGMSQTINNCTYGFNQVFRANNQNALDRVVFGVSGGSFTAGSVSLSYFTES